MPLYQHVSTNVWMLWSILFFRVHGENLMLLFKHEHDIHMKLTSTWQVSANTNNQCLPLVDKAQRLCFEKQNLTHIFIVSSPAALRLSSLSPYEIVLVPPAVVRSHLPVTCLLWTGSLEDLALGCEWWQQWWRGWQSMRSWQVSVTLSLSLLCLSLPCSLCLCQGHGWALPSGDAGPWRSQGANADGGR